MTQSGATFDKSGHQPQSSNCIKILPHGIGFIYFSHGRRFLANCDSYPAFLVFRGMERNGKSGSWNPALKGPPASFSVQETPWNLILAVECRGRGDKRYLGPTGIPNSGRSSAGFTSVDGSRFRRRPRKKIFQIF
ncbi:hypothetical protein JTE90_014961 [Oedothorax gibbosus]|uniref:Ribosomal protein L2 n=1 Tax=Oedothorax gibbosus TaxID=931172 RepID=A0AAV6UZ23_9ARAC|nr:hypothetical protein JTE90_014961 [Oedothorax gibbosus]